MDFRSFSSVTADSREVKPGCLFVAVAGGTVDGHDFIDFAIQNGAAAIIGQRALESPLAVPYTKVEDSRLALAEAAAAFYGHPTRQMKVVGITGTSGKTTSTFLLESILHAAGFKVGVIGSVNFRHGDAHHLRVLPATHTTPGPVELQRLISLMKSEGATHLVMEVSSHALMQKRAHGIEFDVTAFTNLSPEHLDFHKDMEGYFAAKKVLFTELHEAARRSGKAPVSVINLDDPYGQRLAKELESGPANPKVLGFSLASRASIDGTGLMAGLDGISGPVGDSVIVESPLTGRFNASNILTAIASAKALGIPDPAISEGIGRLKGIPGRLERVPNPRGIHVFVDYAHKPDALEKVLQNLRALREGHRLITVFGCGGDRDRSKRPVMGRLAQQLSDFVIVTSDNPRSEDPHVILREIVAGMSETPRFLVEPDRTKAIHQAIQRASPGDLVLIAGKGHESYQIIGNETRPFDDRKVAAEALLHVT